MNEWDAKITAALSGYRVSCIIIAAQKLELFDKLEQGPMTAKEMAGESLFEENLERLLAGVQFVGLVHRQGAAWALTEAGARFVAEDSLVRHAAALAADYIKPWASLAEAVAWGKARHVIPYQEIFGISAWEHRANRSDRHEAFTHSMRLHAAAAVELILTSDVLDDDGTVVDVAGGEGLILTGLLMQRPKLHGVLIERPEMIERAKALPGLKYVGLRMSLQPGDIFDLKNLSLPTKRCPFLLVNVLHDWNDAAAEQILVNCRDSASELVIVERLGDENLSMQCLFDLHMMAVTGGKQRSAQQFDRLFAKTGWKRESVIHDESSGFSLVVAV